MYFSRKRSMVFVPSQIIKCVYIYNVYLKCMDDESLDSYHTAEESDDELEGFCKVASDCGFIWFLPENMWCSYDTWELVDAILFSFK